MSRILVIEDDSEVREMIREILAREGHEVIEAVDGSEGVQIYTNDPTEIVITDIMMPEKDGVETIRELKQQDPNLRVVAVTGFRGSFNRLPAAEFVGAQKTLVKPFDRKALLSAVEDLLNE